MSYALYMVYNIVPITVMLNYTYMTDNKTIYMRYIVSTLITVTRRII